MILVVIVMKKKSELEIISPIASKRKEPADCDETLIPSPAKRIDSKQSDEAMKLVSSKTSHLNQRTSIFAKIDIPKGQCLGFVVGLITNATEFIASGEKCASIALNDQTNLLTLRKVRNFTYFLRYSANHANVTFLEETPSKVSVIASRKINAGDQILVDYPLYTEKYFLNPSDNTETAQEFYEKHTESYHKTSIQSLDFFKIGKEFCYLSNVISDTILSGKNLENASKKACSVNLPILKLKKDGTVSDYLEWDVVTPLMLACYLGQVENVTWLLKQDTYIDQLQHTSGHCAMSCALEAYKRHSTKPIEAAQSAAAVSFFQPAPLKTAIYLEIITLLIYDNAQVAFYDKDDNTFFHQAIDIISRQDFEEIIKVMKLQRYDLLESFSYINKDDLDPVMYCLQKKNFDLLPFLVTELLQVNPGYFNDYFNEKNTIFLDEYLKTLTEEQITLLNKIRVEEKGLHDVLVGIVNKPLSEASASSRCSSLG